MTAPLEGVVVADFSRVLAGPMATSMLADLGATVIKVERPSAGDDTRSWGPPWTGTSSSYFESANRSKKSIELDLGDESDRAVAHDLVRRADVLVENFRTGSLDRYGLGPSGAAALNPRIVYCSVTGFGSGVGAALPGYDFVVQAVGGLMSITGDAEGQPTKAGVALVDVLTGKDAVIAVLAALATRERTGRGEHVEVNLLSSLLGSLVNQATSYLSTGHVPTRVGNQHPSIAPYETLQCRQGAIAVACGNDRQFQRLVGALGRPDMAHDERFAINAARVENRHVMVQLLEDALRTGSAPEWVSALEDAGVPVGEVGDIGTAFAYAQRLGLEPTVAVGDGHPDQVRHPITYSSSTIRKPTAPPRLGQHNDEIRRWLAGGKENP